MSSNGRTRISVVGVLLNRRWLAAIGGVVLVLVLSRECGREEAPIAAAVAAHGAVDRVLEGKIQEQRQVATAARKAESVAVVRKEKKVAELRAERAKVVLSAQSERRTSVLTEVCPGRSDSLVDQILSASDTALSAANVQIAALTTALDFSEARAMASKSALADAAKRSSERCRMLGFVPCPSRLAAVALTALAAGALLLR